MQDNNIRKNGDTGKKGYMGTLGTFCSIFVSFSFLFMKEYNHCYVWGCEF